MATDFKDSKKPFGATFPERAIDGTGLYAEIEPLLDGKTMQRRYLFGIPLISPMTKEKLSNEDFEDFVMPCSDGVTDCFDPAFHDLDVNCASP
jgi:hypothetical protein